MPITPKFSLSQSEEFVFVDIKLPHIRISNAELITDGREFSFYCKPYLLKLKFPFELLGDDDRCKATYDASNDNGTLLAFLPKAIHGQNFPDLDLTTKLLQKHCENFPLKNSTSGIEVLKSTVFSSDEEGDVSYSQNGSYMTEMLTPHYGFNQKYCSIFKDLREELVDIIELSEPEKIPADVRRKLKISAENALFDPMRYLGDMFSIDDFYMEALKYESFWDRQWAVKRTGQQNSPDLKQVGESPSCLRSSDASFDVAGGFDAIEIKMLSDSLPRREYLITPASEQEYQLLLGIADLLFAFAYEYRLTCGEATVESPSNITRLSSLLSWLDAFNQPGDNAYTVILHCCRRSLIYPYLRVWKLTRKILADVAKILILGKRCVLKCLLQLRGILEHTDTHYLLNKLFLDDYCVWVQSLQDASLKQFARQYNDAKSALESNRQPPPSVIAASLYTRESEVSIGTRSALPVNPTTASGDERKSEQRGVETGLSSDREGGESAEEGVHFERLEGIQNSQEVFDSERQKGASIETGLNSDMMQSTVQQQIKAVGAYIEKSPLQIEASPSISVCTAELSVATGRDGDDDAMKNSAISVEEVEDGKKLKTCDLERRSSLPAAVGEPFPAAANPEPVGKAALGLNLVAIEEWGRQQVHLLEEGLLAEPEELPAELWPLGASEVSQQQLALSSAVEPQSGSQSQSIQGEDRRPELLTSDVCTLLEQLKLTKPDDKSNCLVALS